MVVLADKNREKELIEIWKQSFGDSEEYIRMFLDWNISKIKVFVYETDGCAVSVAYLLPLKYKNSDGEEYPCWYLYAAATLPEYRGKGYFAEIMKYIQENSEEPVMLVPGEESLIGYYKKLGLKVGLEGKSLELVYKDVSVDIEKYDIRELSAEEYAFKRKGILSEIAHIEWDDHFIAYICQENVFCGGTQKEVILKDNKYVVMYRTEDQKMRILEILRQKEMSDLLEMEQIVQLLLKETGCIKAEICLNPVLMVTEQIKEIGEVGYFNLTMG